MDDLTLNHRVDVTTSPRDLHERHRTVDDRQAAGQPDGRAPVYGGSVTHQLRSVVTHLHLVHPPTLAVGSAVLAMLFVIAWRFPRSPGPLIAMILAGGCVALFDLASNGIHTIGAVPRGLPVPTLPSLTGIDIATFA
jgi:sulfate permease, SulP family